MKIAYYRSLKLPKALSRTSSSSLIILLRFWHIRSEPPGNPVAQLFNRNFGRSLFHPFFCRSSTEPVSALLAAPDMWEAASFPAMVPGEYSHGAPVSGVCGYSGSVFQPAYSLAHS